jgi:predicted dehydrogenase
MRGPKRGGPVRVALVGYGKQGRQLRSLIDPDVMELVSICDIRPAKQQDALSTAGERWYQDWRRMLNQEHIEAVVIATPLYTHAEIASGCLEAGKHVFCESAMAMDAKGCRQMIQAAQRTGCLLQIGYQEYYDPLHWAAYHNIVRAGMLGDIYTVRGAWHSNNSGRVVSVPDHPSVDPRPWGYASLDQLQNWRLYRRYSNGLTAEWGGPLVSLTNWYLDAVPVSVQATGGIYSFKDGRDVGDHIYATLEYPNGRTATLSLIQSNGFEGSYSQFMGTKGTLIISRDEALLFTEESSRPATIAVAKLNGSQPLLDTSASRAEEASNHSALSGGANVEPGDSRRAFQEELAAFSGAIRTGAPLRSDLAHAFNVAGTCLAIDSAIEKGMPAIPAGLMSASYLVPNGLEKSRSQHV